MSSSALIIPVPVVVKDDGADSAKKRKSDENLEGAASKVMKLGGEGDSDHFEKPLPPKTKNKAKEIRLEQNRKAARESRRRKKVMIEELQRSVIFFSRANGTLKQQNDELTRFLMQAQMQIAAIESHTKSSTSVTSPTTTDEAKSSGDKESLIDLAQAKVIATQAMYETKGFPAAAARAAAQALSGNATLSPPKDLALASKDSSQSAQSSSLPAMQPGATMQAMANFQQAAAVAMQSAMGQMQNVPGVSLSQLSVPPAGTNAQQVYTDAMTALAMQQAAVAAATGMIQPHPGMQFLQPLLPPWQQQQLPQQMSLDGKKHEPPEEGKKD